MTAAPFSARVIERGGSVVLGGAFVVLFGLALWLPTLSAVYGLAFAAAVVALPLVLWATTRHPLGPLAGALVFFGFISRNKAGIQPEEIAFALYYLGFLSHWFVTRALVYKERIVRGGLDLVLVGFLLYVTASVGLTIVFGGKLSGAMSEWVNFSMFAFYFPIREAV
ncbi:MAG TPA: hypothetical protein EYG39_02945, partial [Rhodothermales bacterium]|nr:hypothetical protein [Rhodothermales bacterium]